MNPKQLLAHFDRLSDAPDAIPRLRRFILDLAVRGKLVEQAFHDTSSETSINSLAKKRATLLAKGLLRRIETSSPVDECHPFTIPSSWVWCFADQLSKPVNNALCIGPFGSNLITSDYTADGVPLVFVRDIRSEFSSESKHFVSSAKAESLSSHSVEPGDLLITKMGDPPGDTAIYPVERPRAIITADCIKWTLDPEIADVRYFYYAIRAPRIASQIMEITKGAAHQKISLKRFRGVYLPLPPLAEQKRIVAKVDELMGLCDRLEAAQKEREARRDRLAAASLNRLNQPDEDANADPSTFRQHVRFHLNNLPRLTTRPDQIPQLRQTILNLAVRGKLVPQDPSDEPANEVLKRIQAEKVRLVKEGRIKKDKAVWDGSSKEVSSKIPSNWIWTSLQELFEISRGSSPRPAGDPLYFGGPIPWITVGEITKDDNKYLTATLSGLTEKGAARSRFISVGDLLLTNSGATLGVPKISQIGGCINDGVAVLRIFHDCELNEFSYLYLTSQTSAFRSVNQGMGQPNLNTPIIASWPFPLPPLAEQKRIVAKVEELMGVCDRLEAQLTTTRTESRRLLEAVLHEALAPAPHA